jgi:hypothetical protein
VGELGQKINRESVYDKLLEAFGLGRAPPHELKDLGEQAWGSESLVAQLVHLAQRATRTSLASFGRLVSMVLSHTKRSKDPPENAGNLQRLERG